MIYVNGQVMVAPYKCPLPPAPSLGVAIAFEEDDLWAGAAAAVVTILVTWQTHKHGPSPISRQIPFPTSIDSIQIRILDNRSPRLAFFDAIHPTTQGFSLLQISHC